MTQSQSADKDSVSLSDLIMGVVVVAILVSTVLLIYSYRRSIATAFKEIGYRSLAIASQPEGADVLLDSVYVGKSPVTVETSAGAHTITVKKDGFVTSSSAIDLDFDTYTGPQGNRKLVHKAAPWILNVNLQSRPGAVASAPVPASTPTPTPMSEPRQESKAPTSTPTAASKTRTGADVEMIDSMAILATKVSSLERENSQFQNEIRDLRSVWLQFLSISAASLIGIFGIALTIILARRRSPSN